MVYVTHDQEEAMTLGGRVGVMRDGALEQLAPPMELFRTPVNVFVARFIGSPAMNVLRCEWSRDSETRHLVRPGLSIEVDSPQYDIGGGEAVLVGVRPHDIALAAADDSDATGRIEILDALGATVLAHVRIDELPDGVVRVVASSEERLSVDQQVHLRLRREALHFFAEPTGARLVGRAL
jgi:ABC-type sugar transport system ATPase subunit